MGSKIEAYLEAQRKGLSRLDPQQAFEESNKQDGAYLIDIRPESFRLAEGQIPGSIVLERNVLEWRLDPTSPDSIQEARQPNFTPIIMCNEGYASSLAAKVLQGIGVKNATDLDGGFRRWKQEGLPTAVSGDSGQPKAK